MVQLQRVAPVTAALEVRALSHPIYRPCKKKTNYSKNIRLWRLDWRKKNVNLMLGNADRSSCFVFLGKKAAAVGQDSVCMV